MKNNTIKLILSILPALTVSISSYAQEEPKIKISGYVETYFGYDFNKPASNNRPGFVYSHNRHNEVNLNLGFIKAAYDSGKVRANMALMAGTYSNANLSAEPGVLKNILEANAGVRLSNKHQLWIDAGVFSSHIGFEGAISKDCWVLTRNISSENTPYYESGAKMSYVSPEGQFTAVLLYLNGWQKINRADGNSQPAGGVQLNYKPVGNLTLNYSNYIGTEGIDANRVTRIYHNFYAIAQLTEQFGVTAGFDYGTQQKVKGESEKSEVISPVLIAQYKFTPKFAMAARGEYYKDRDGIIVSTETEGGFKTMGYSLNMDYSPVSNAVLRLEGKVYDSKSKIFARDLSMVNHNASLTASIAVSF